MPGYGARWSPLDEQPDDVKPEDLKPGVGITPSGQIGMGGDIPMAAQAADAGLMVPAAAAPPKPVGTDPEALAGLDLPPQAPVMPEVTPKPPRSGGGGGGGSAAVPGVVPGQMTKDEMLARGAEKTAQENEGAAIAREGENKAQIAEAANKQDTADVNALAAHQKSVSERMAAATSYLQQKQDERSKMKVRDMFEGHPIAGLAGALMAGLGQFGAGLNGQPNGAMHVLDDAAKMFREKEMIRLDQAEKSIGDAKERLEVVRMGAAAEEAGLWKRLGAERAQNLSRFGADAARIEADKTYQHTQAMQAKAETEWQTMLHNRGQQEVMQGAQLGLIKSETAKNYAAASAEKASKKNTEGSLDVTGPGGRTLFTARSPAEAKEANDKVAAVRDVMTKAKKLRELLAQGPTAFGYGERARQMDSLQSNLLISMNKAEHLGALDKGSTEILGQQIPNRSGAFGGGVDAMDQTIANLRTNASNNFDSYGIPGAKLLAHLEKADTGSSAGGGASAPSRSEYAQIVAQLRAAKPGSPEYDRLMTAARSMRAAIVGQ